MNITALTIENFKGISEPVRVEFKPITLLFGPNSAGKSTIVQALHYIREILERNNVDPDKCIGADESIDLGGFTNLVHNHDLNRSIRFKIEIAADDIEFPEYRTVLNEGPHHRTDIVYYGWGVSAKTIWVEIEVKWSEILNKPIVLSYGTGFNGHPYSLICCDEDGKRVRLVSLNYRHPDLENYFLSMCNEILSREHSLNDKSCEYFLGGMETPIPKWGTPLNFPWAYYTYEDEQTGVEVDRISEKIADFEGAYLSTLIVGPGEILLNLLKSGRYIGPIRKIPPRGYAPVRYEDESRWASGLAAWDLLYKADPSLVAETSDWLSRPDRLNSGYSLRMYRYKKLDLDGDFYKLLLAKGVKGKSRIDSQIKQLPEERQLLLIDDRRGLEILPQDVGIGISQILPVVVGSLDKGTGILMVEQPELHIHPGLQVSLGDLFISQIQDEEKMFIIETHSEHLLLRLLRRIRETNDDELPEGVDALTSEQLSINYIDCVNGSLRVKRLDVSHEGDSLGSWPNGFFEERAGELF
jgi:hypothetical protein